MSIGLPEPGHRRTAYFRDRFRTDREHRALELLCYRDDGIIVYLDGKEVARDNVNPGLEAYSLSATETVASKVDTHFDGTAEEELAVIPLDEVVLPPGEHVLAISLHNHIKDDTPSSDLRIGGIRLLSGLPAVEAD